MTGSYNQRFGMQWNDDRRKYKLGEHQLLPQALRAAGYVTGHIGKWNVPVDPKECFDEIYDLIDWEADYFPDANGHYYGVDSETEFASSKRQGVWGPERPGEEYLTDRIGRHAVEFVEKHKRSGKPFFLYLAFNAVHTPLHAKQEQAARFGNLPIALNFYAPMVASLDENIGRVLAALPDNTLVAFTSDNGPAKMPVEKWPDGWPKGMLNGSAGPLNGHKGQFLDGGIREPFLLRWPGKLKPGSVYRQPVSTMDLYPTFCAAAGAPVPAGTRLDGVNLLPFLTGEKTGRRTKSCSGKTVRTARSGRATGSCSSARGSLSCNCSISPTTSARNATWPATSRNWSRVSTRRGSTGVRHCRPAPTPSPASRPPPPPSRVRRGSLTPPKRPTEGLRRIGRPSVGPVARSGDRPHATRRSHRSHRRPPRSRRPVRAERQEPRRPTQPRGIPCQPDRPGSRENTV